MEKVKIVEAIGKYLDNKLTDYAVMITGDWGVGKTYFLKNDLFELFKKLGLKPIYVSLIGLNDDSQLERLIFQKINPFFNSINKSVAAREAEYIESIINGSEKPEINIPEKFVLCFDDLERIEPAFFAAAMGFINVFIEHHKTKSIFICNEDILESNQIFPTYKTIKEKYIRFTYPFTPNLHEVLNAKLSDKEAKNKSYFDESIIVEMFKRGKSDNLRTLFFTLSIFEQCLSEFEKLPDNLPHKNEILKLVLTYCCFYTIEIKKGTPHGLLDKITIARNQKILLPLLEDFKVNDEFNEDKEQGDDLSSKKESERLLSIQQSYFYDNSIDFERFASIAELINGGYFDSGMFEKEVNKLSKALEANVQGDKADQIIHMLDDVFKYSDDELHHKIEELVEEVKKGSLNLVDYSKLYQTLVWLESLRIKGVIINDSITNSFKDGVKRASQTRKLEYIPSFRFQNQWDRTDKTKYAKKYFQFVEFVDSINEEILNKDESNSFTTVLDAIAGNKENELLKLLSAKSSVQLSKQNAKEIYNGLVHAKASTIDKFISALQGRYSNDGNLVSQLPKNEENFIFTLFDLLIKNRSLNLKNKKSLNEVTLMFLKNYLEKLIEYHFPEKKKSKNEE